MKTLCLPKKRPDAQGRMHSMIAATVSFFRQHHRTALNAELLHEVRRIEPYISLRTLQNYIHDFAAEWEILDAFGEGERQRLSEAVQTSILIHCGEIKLAEGHEPHIAVTQELRDSLEILPALRRIVERTVYTTRELTAGASAQQDADRTTLRLQHLIDTLEGIRDMSGPTFPLARELLRLDQPQTSFRAGGEHPIWDMKKQALVLNDQEGPHPDNRSGLLGVLGPEFLEPARIVHPDQLLTHLNDNLVVVGGAPSELISRIHLGYVGSTYDRFRRQTDLLPLPFWEYSDAEEVRQVSGMAARWIWDYKKLAFVKSERPNWWICAEGSRRYVPDVDPETRQLVSDYLLITRLRNCFVNDGRSKFTHIAGTHGIGTKAASLLTGNIDVAHRQLLHDIDHELQSADEFQILLKVTEIERAFEPKRLKLVAAVPLKISDDQYLKLHAWIRGELDRVMPQACPLNGDRLYD